MKYCHMLSEGPHDQLATESIEKTTKPTHTYMEIDVRSRGEIEMPPPLLEVSSRAS